MSGIKSQGRAHNVSVKNKMQEYLEYWGLTDPAFQSAPNIDNLFIPLSWRSRLDRVLLFAEQSPSLIAVTSQSGHCKSTMAHWFYQNIDPQSHEVLLLSLFQEEYEAGWLVPKLCRFLGLKNTGVNASLEELSDNIENITLEGRTLTIIIDEAHKLKSPKAMSEIHTLISMQSLIQFGVNFILIGNEQLEDTIEQTPEFQNRLSLSCRLEALDSNEIMKYLSHQLALKNIDSKIILPDAMELIEEHTGGIFSRINALLENSLIEAFLRKEKTINSQIVDQAVEFLPGQKSRRQTPKAPKRTQTPRSEPKHRPQEKVKPARRKKEPSTAKAVDISSLFYKTDKKQ